MIASFDAASDPTTPRLSKRTKLVRDSSLSDILGCTHVPDLHTVLGHRTTASSPLHAGRTSRAPGYTYRLAAAWKPNLANNTGIPAPRGSAPKAGFPQG